MRASVPIAATILCLFGGGMGFGLELAVVSDAVPSAALVSTQGPNPATLQSEVTRITSQAALSGDLSPAEGLSISGTAWTLLDSLPSYDPTQVPPSRLDFSSRLLQLDLSWQILPGSLTPESGQGDHPSLFGLFQNPSQSHLARRRGQRAAADARCLPAMGRGMGRNQDSLYRRGLHAGGFLLPAASVVGRRQRGPAVPQPPSAGFPGSAPRRRACRNRRHPGPRPSEHGRAGFLRSVRTLPNRRRARFESRRTSDPSSGGYPVGFPGSPGRDRRRRSRD